MTERPIKIWLRLLLVFVAGGAWGCVTETHEAPPTMGHFEIVRPDRPPGVRPEQMMLSAGVPSDGDGNTYPDTVPVVVYLFGDTSRYALPLHERGVFEFELSGPEAGHIGRWVFPEAETERALGSSAAGVCYRFGLRLAAGRDEMPTQTVSLRAAFTDSKTGRRITSQGTVTIRLGEGS